MSFHIPLLVLHHFLLDVDGLCHCLCISHSWLLVADTNVVSHLTGNLQLFIVATFQNHSRLKRHHSETETGERSLSSLATYQLDSVFPALLAVYFDVKYYLLL